jgi:hypothetical protein
MLDGTDARQLWANQEGGELVIREWERSGDDWFSFHAITISSKALALLKTWNGP